MKGRAWGNGSSVLSAAFLGALMAVALIPGARSTVEAQMELALGRRPEWMRAASGASPARLKRALAADPNDVALQVGAATLLPTLSDAGPGGNGSASVPSSRADGVALRRLNRVAERFPNDASVRAHQLRYLAQVAVRIRESDEPGPSEPPVPQTKGVASGPPAPEAVRAFAVAAAAGGALEPENGFFDAMKAVGEFAAGQDQEALRDLHRAASKPHWDDHAVEEPRAQWKLLQAAYGQHGALQELPASHSLVLPQFGKIRAAARRAVWHVAQRERAGDLAGAITIRHDVMQLGMSMAEAPPAVIGKWISLDLVDIGSGPTAGDPPLNLAPPMNPERVQRLQHERDEWYERFLRAHGVAQEADWVHQMRGRADALREQLGRLNGPDSIYPPVLLAVWWLFDTMIVRQAAGLMLLWCVAALLGLARVRITEESRARATVKWVLVLLAVFLTPVTMGAAAGLLEVTRYSVDMGPVLRLITSALVLWAGSALLARAGGQGQAQPRSVKVLRWLSASLALLMLPFVLVAIAGPNLGFWGPLGVGAGMVGLLGLSRRAGRRVHRAERPPRWQPGLAALISVLLSSLFLFPCLMFVSFQGFGTEQEVTGLGILTAFSTPLLMLVPVPALLVTFAALCRVTALELPLRAGLSRVVRQMAPYAMALLALIYIAALVPTLAGDRASQRTLDQIFSRDVSASQNMR